MPPQPVPGTIIPNTTITLAKEYFKFSIAHFTIFSATERERLHGHNYTVAAELDTRVGDNGLADNYRDYKQLLKQVCQNLDEYLLLPEHSPHLNIETAANDYIVRFNQETLTFPIRDTKILPVRNITVEELSRYLLQQVLDRLSATSQSSIRRLKLFVSSGPGQSGASEWRSQRQLPSVD